MSVLASGACGLACGRVLRYCAKCQLPNKDAGKKGGGQAKQKQHMRSTCPEPRRALRVWSKLCQLPEHQRMGLLLLRVLPDGQRRSPASW